MTNSPPHPPLADGDDAGESPEAPRANPVVVEILRSLGLTESAAAVAARGGEVLRLLSVASASAVELAAVLDASSGGSLGPHVSGSEHGVDIAPLLERALPGHRYVVIHTHPAGASFSFDDATVFVEHHEIAVLTAVTNAGAWYAFGGHGTGRRADRATVARYYVRAMAHLRATYVRRVAGGELSGEAALVELEHEVWTTIADQIGIRYLRYDGGGE